MAQDKAIDPAIMLANVEAKISALQALRDSLRAAISVGALGPVTDASAFGSSSGIPDLTPIDLPTNPFIGKSVPAAIKLYLSSVRKKQTIREIAAALKDGGIESTSGNFESVVTGALNRLKHDGLVLRFKEGFAWAELYPEHIRKSVVAANQAGKRRTKLRKRKTIKRSSPEKHPEAAKEEGTEERILKLLRSKPNTEFTANDVSSSLGLRIQTVHFLLGKLVFRKHLERIAGGKFKAIAAA